MRSIITPLGLSLAACGLLALIPGGAHAQSQKVAGKPVQKAIPAGIGFVKKGATSVSLKPLSAHVTKGLAWLVKSQLDNGGWGQGEESEAMGRGLALKDKPSVADTCMATMALLRSGSTPSSGEYAKSIRHGIEYVCAEIEESDKSSLYITSNRSTRIQIKLVPYIDTFGSEPRTTPVASLPTRRSPAVRRECPGAAGSPGEWGDVGE